MLPSHAHAGKGVDFAGSTAQYRNSALAALNASVTRGDVVVIHNYWQAGEESLHAKYYEEAIVKAITEPRGARLLASNPPPSQSVAHLHGRAAPSIQSSY